LCVYQLNETATLLLMGTISLFYEDNLIGIEKKKQMQVFAFGSELLCGVL
jgi:hypothetical protein